MSTLGLITGRMRNIWVNRSRQSRNPEVHSYALFPPPPPEQLSPLLVRALCEGSNLKLEWLWYANQMTSVPEREYCLARARWIGAESG